MPKMVAAVVDLIQENCITISEIAIQMEISIYSAHTIAAEQLHYCTKEKSLCGGFLGISNQISRNNDRMCVPCLSHGMSRKERHFEVLNNQR
jgi:hypothetical protein